MKRLFDAEFFVVDVALEAASCLHYLREKEPSAVVLALSHSPLEALQQITRLAPTVPVIVLNAKTEVSDKVLMLEMGAHDYVTKPYSPRELLARVRAAVRRSAQSGQGKVLTFGNTRVNFLTMEATHNGRPVPLTRKQFETLEFLACNPKRIVTRQELLDKVWGFQHCPHTRTVDNQILQLRQKLELDPSHPTHFLTVHHAGYRFVP